MRLIPFSLAFCLLPCLAIADTFGGWDFTPPEGYERTTASLGVTYTGPNGGFIFLPQTAAPGATVTEAATAMMDEALPA
ncbi:MAG: hypothetical protein ACRC6I_14540, partial [Paracoccaceae bacterium]